MRRTAAGEDRHTVMLGLPMPDGRHNRVTKWFELGSAGRWS
jgi:hypothetical protein